MKYSMIIPVYNSEASLNELCDRLISVFTKVIKSDFEIILVNDASKDNSWNIMKVLHNKDNRIKIINLAKNSGQHSAMVCGMNYFSGDFVILMDDDLQHPPEEIPKLINSITNNDEVDVVIGTFLVKKHSFIRNLGSKAMQEIEGRIFDTRGMIRFTNFRIMRASIAHAIAKIQINKPRVGILILQTTRKIASVVVDHDDRKYGKSGYTFIRLVKDFSLNIINNSSMPLKLISYIGIALSLLSFLLAMYFVYRYYVFGISVKGWTTLIVVNCLLSGFILFSLGLIGEYLIRILMEAKKLPNYFVREKFF